MGKKKEKYVIDTNLYVQHSNSVSACVRNCLFSSTYFDKVSESQFERDLANNIPISWDVNSYNVTNADVKKIYDDIRLPERATIGSAGYDFFAPFDFTLYKGQTIVIPTGIRWISKDPIFFLSLYPRSGFGFKFGLSLANTVGIIDSDYHESANEGHIMVKLSNDGIHNKDISFKTGDAFCQGIILPFLTTTNDDCNSKEKRNGGFGSTDKKD